MLGPLENRKRLEVLRANEAFELAREQDIRQALAERTDVEIVLRFTDAAGDDHTIRSCPVVNGHYVFDESDAWGLRAIGLCKATETDHIAALSGDYADRCRGECEPIGRCLKPSDVSLHGTTSMYARGCRCRQCRDARNQYDRHRRRVRSRLGPPKAVHGTPEGFRLWGCRCDSCVFAAEKFRRAILRDPSVHGRERTYRIFGCRCAACTLARAKHRKAVRTDPSRPHGTASMYGDYGCRCNPCTEAHRDAARDARAKAANKPVPQHIHGTQNGYSNHGCRCSKCRRAATEAVSESRRKASTRPTPTNAHGTRKGYDYYGCRCDRCKSAGAAYAKKMRKLATRRPVPRDAHGTSSAYRHYGCRCNKCRAAEASRKKELRAAS